MAGPGPNIGFKLTILIQIRNKIAGIDRTTIYSWPEILPSTPVRRLFSFAPTVSVLYWKGFFILRTSRNAFCVILPLSRLFVKKAHGSEMKRSHACGNVWLQDLTPAFSFILMLRRFTFDWKIQSETSLFLRSVSVREIPGHVPGIRLGNRLEEPKEDLLALGLELLHIIWNHDGPFK